VSPLLGLSRAELEEVCLALGEPAFRGRQVAEWLYRHGVRSFAEMANLPRPLRDRLAEDYTPGRSHVVAVQEARDGTTKYLLELADGERIECVRMPYADRQTVCLSSQTGCALGCAFCATGTLGAGRNLTAGEIVDQVLTAGHSPSSPCSPSAAGLTHVVFMGMGEPLLNYDAVLQAVHLLQDEVGIARRRITLSTIGIVPAIRRLAREKLQLTLAISLHAPDDDLRAELIPTAGRKWTVAEVVGAAREYVAATGRRVTFEYVLLAGVNDHPDQARRLAQRLRGLQANVNLIPFNPVEGLPYTRPDRGRIRRFREALEAAGVPVTQRRERGGDIDAACGQLRARGADG